ncbi:HNH endonuclease [Undibacterium sp. Ji67W]|uniref:HNH endonuclease n=1 Tax=Undibacterium sp. Ji67W TaxID=3413042 RepID=UPI003BF42B4B
MKNRWIDDICIALANLGGIAHRTDLLNEIKRIRPLPHPEKIEETVQSTIQNHSSDSKSFKGEDLIYSVKGIGSGIWGLRSMLSFTPKANDIQDIEVPTRVMSDVYRILRDTELSRKLKLLYQNKFQLCGQALQLSNGETYAEAHHIWPLGQPHNGPDIAENIIVLCPNHHVQLDYGAIEIFAANIMNVSNHQIGEKYIQYHNSAICKLSQKL